MGKPHWKRDGAGLCRYCPKANVKLAREGKTSCFGCEEERKHRVRLAKLLKEMGVVGASKQRARKKAGAGEVGWDGVKVAPVPKVWWWTKKWNGRGWGDAGA